MTSLRYGVGRSDKFALTFFILLAQLVCTYVLFVPYASAQEPAVAAPTELKPQETPQLNGAQGEADEEEFAWAQSPKPVRFVLGTTKSSGRKGGWIALLEEQLPALNTKADAQILTPRLLQKLRDDIAALLATEGYFSSVTRFEKSRENAELVQIHIDAGQRTNVRLLDIQFEGPFGALLTQQEAEAVQRKNRLQAAWPLPVGQAFRDEDWRKAKADLVDQLRADRYAAARLSDSSGSVDADNYGADLLVSVDSGPAFFLGELKVTGLERYPRWLLDRFSPPQKGEVFSRKRLFEYQRALQNSPYFASVGVNVEPDPELAAAVPVEVTVRERQARDIGFGVGYSTNTGYRAEVTYKDRNLFGQAWEQRSAVRIEQKRQLAYTDIYLPPRNRDQVDSFGVLFDRLDVEGLLQTRVALGAKRTITDGKWERRYGLNLSQEKLALDGVVGALAQSRNRALVGSFGATWRQVDNNFAPRDGQIAQLDVAASEKALISDRSFLRLDLKYQRWLPIGLSDHILLRAEVGQVLSPAQVGAEGIPEDYLFRTGGSTSVRGYAFQSLGVRQGQSVTGGRVLGVASAEYVHQINETWGAASFVDIGDAAKTWREFASKQGLGVGARYQTPAGPIALDLAYGRQIKKFRIDFSIAVAF